MAIKIKRVIVVAFFFVSNLHREHIKPCTYFTNMYYYASVNHFHMTWNTSLTIQCCFSYDGIGNFAFHSV